MHRIRLKFLSEVSYKVTVTCVSNTLYNYGLFWGEKALEGIANLYETFGAKPFSCRFLNYLVCLGRFLLLYKLHMDSLL